MYGRRWFWGSSFWIYTIFNIQCGLAKNIGTLLSGRFLCGLFASSSLVIAGGTISDIWVFTLLRCIWYLWLTSHRITTSVDLQLLCKPTSFDFEIYVDSQLGLPLLHMAALCLDLSVSHPPAAAYYYTHTELSFSGWVRWRDSGMERHYLGQHGFRWRDGRFAHLHP